MYRLKLLQFVILCVIMQSCQTKNSQFLEVEQIIDDIKERLAPDKRTVLYTIQTERKENRLVVSGETSSQKAYLQLQDALSKLSNPINFQVDLLPTKAVAKLQFGLTRNSVSNLRSKPKHSAELATQSIMGHPLKVLKQEGEWYLVQCGDKYIAWVDHGGIQLLDKAQYSSWIEDSKVIFTSIGGSVYASKLLEKPICDIVYGSLLLVNNEFPGSFQVTLPDGRTGFVQKSEAQYYEQWLNNSKEDPSDFALKLLGLPYLWGGTSSKGLDCSGFTKTIYLSQGLVIPRDASQQILAGNSIDGTKGFEHLEKGDLLFFGSPKTYEKRERVVHVGMWLGDGQRYIHASGNVHINTMDSKSSHYDEFNFNRYLRTRRFKKSDGISLDLSKENLYQSLYSKKTFQK